MKANYEDQTCLNEIKKNSTSLEREAQRCFEGIKASRTCVLLIQRSKRLYVSQCFESERSVNRLCCELNII